MIWAVIILACHEQFMSAKIWIKNDFTIIFRLDKNRFVWYNNLRLGCVAKTIEYYRGVAAGSALALGACRLLSLLDFSNARIPL